MLYDEHNRKITKLRFLEALITYKYLPLRLASEPGTWAYKLYPFNRRDGQNVAAIVGEMANYDLNDYKTEGTKLPPFKLTDIDGKTYTNANTKGKILVLKSWFIKCHACVEEMPELNTIVDRYKYRKDILFVSIAFDSKKDLRQFIQHKEFKYAISPVSEDFIEHSLGVTVYPTHWVINKQGEIVKRTNECGAMIETLAKLAAN